MRQVAARGEAKPHDGVARLQQSQHDRLVRLAAGVRLHIGEGAIEQALGAVDGDLLDDVDILAAAVIALARIAFGIFVGEQRAGGIEHGLRDDILGRDQLDLVLLALGLMLDRIEDLWVSVLEMPGEKAASARLGAPRITCRHGYCSLSSTRPALAKDAFPAATGRASNRWPALPYVVGPRQQHPTGWADAEQHMAETIGSRPIWDLIAAISRRKRSRARRRDCRCRDGTGPRRQACPRR